MQSFSPKHRTSRDDWSSSSSLSMSWYRTPFKCSNAMCCSSFQVPRPSMYVRWRCQHPVGTELAKSSERMTACSGGGCEPLWCVAIPMCCMVRLEVQFAQQYRPYSTTCRVRVRPVQALFQKCFMKCCGGVILLGDLQVLPHPQQLERDYSVYCNCQLVPKQPFVLSSTSETRTRTLVIHRTS